MNYAPGPFMVIYPRADRSREHHMMVPGQRYVPKIQNGGEVGEVTTHNSSDLVGEGLYDCIFLCLPQM